MYFRIIVCSLFIVLILSLPVAGADMEKLNNDENTFIQLIEDLDKTMADSYGGISLRDLYENFRTGDFDLSSLPADILTAFTAGYRDYFLVLTQLLILGILAAVFQALRRGDDGIAGAGHWIILLAFSFLAAKSFGEIIFMATEVINKSSDFLYGLLPLLLGFLAAGGSGVSLSVTQPILLVFITIFLGLMERFLIPLVLIFAALVIVGHLAPKYSFKEMRELIRDIILIVLTCMLTLFTAVLSLVGIGAGAVDGLALKTAKLAAGNFIPIVGKHIADAFDAILGASLLIKNTIGLFAIIVIAVVIIVPALKILLAALLFRVVGALLEPLGTGDFSTLLRDFSGALTLVFALVAAAGVLFFFFIFFLVALGNITMMFR